MEPNIPIGSSALSIRALLGLADVPFLRAVVSRYPEILALAGPADSSPEGNACLRPDSLAIRVFEGQPLDETAIEAERTFLALLLFKAVVNGDTTPFPYLSDEGFIALRTLTTAQADTDEACEVILYSLACNDLGKTHAMIGENITLKGQKAPDHDRLLAELVDGNPDCFPVCSG